MEAWEWLTPWGTAKAISSATSEWVFGVDPETGAIEGTEPPSGEPVTASIYAADSSSVLERIAHRFVVDILPPGATSRQRAGWLVFWRAIAIGNVGLMRKMYGIDPDAGFDVTRGAAKIQKLAEEKAGTWQSIFGKVAVPAQMFAALQVDGLRKLISYTFGAVEAGWGAHVGTNPQALVDGGYMTPSQLTRDYFLRLAAYQCMGKLLMNEHTRFLMIREGGPVSGLGAAPVVAAAGLGALPYVAVVAVVIGVCLLVATVAHIAANNRLLENARIDCMRQFERTGKESKLCATLPQAFAASAMNTPAAQLTQQLTKYGVIAGAVVLGIVFLPTIIRSVRSSSQAATAPRVSS